MMSNNLEDLIIKYGSPDAIIDNYASGKYGFAIWGYQDIFKYEIKDYNKIKNPFKILQEKIDFWADKKNKIACIGYVGYDIKNYLFSHIKFKKLKPNIPIIWFAKPKIVKPFLLNNNIKANDFKYLSLKKEILNITDYEKKINLIKNELKEGNTYQINFTMNKQFQIKQDPLKLYLAIRDLVKPAFGYYIKCNNNYILSLSPEQFFNTKNLLIKSYPMKGTRPRSKDKIKDEQFKKSLKNSSKDRAEHLMIVDLLRNDIGKICEYGSVNVRDLFKINSYKTVHQMVSCIEGKLHPNTKNIDIFKALCPGGSITGAPKESSMKIIDLLENYNRGIYTGTIGYIDKNKNMNFNIAIRTIAINNKQASYPVGGGIVWDSIAKEEWEEAQLKSKILNNFID